MQNQNQNSLYNNNAHVIILAACLGLLHGSRLTIPDKEKNKEIPSSVFNNNEEVLLARRMYDPNKGEWSVPGGHVEKNESTVNAAIREIKEECNISLSKNLKVLKYVILQDKEITFFTVKYTGNESISAGSDVSEVKWFKLDQIPKLAWDEIPSIYVASKIV